MANNLANSSARLLFNGKSFSNRVGLLYSEYSEGGDTTFVLFTGGGVKDVFGGGIVKFGVCT